METVPSNKELAQRNLLDVEAKLKAMVDTAVDQFRQAIAEERRRAEAAALNYAHK